MKLLFTADGSVFTYKALEFVVSHPELLAGGQRLLGSIAQRVVTDAELPVLLVK